MRAYVVHYNAPEWCRDTVRSLLASEGVGLDVAVIDNSGTYQPPPNVRVIAPDGNLGYAGGANVGLREWLAGDDPYCLVACHDALVSPDAVALMVAALDGHPEFGMVGVDRGLDGELGAPVEQSWLSGMCFVARRACIEQVGLFDEAFGSYGEDRDLSGRATAAGWKVGSTPGAIASDRGSAHPQFRKIMYTNRALLYYKRSGVVGVLRWLAVLPLHAARDVRGLFCADLRTVSADRLRWRLWTIPAALWKVVKHRR